MTGADVIGIDDESRKNRDRPVLQVSNLTTSLRLRDRSVPIVRDINLELFEGRTLAILGESGSGKSVTARSILRLYGRNMLHSGSIRVCGQELIDHSESEVARLRGPVMAYVPQDPNSSLDPLRKVKSQLFDTMRGHDAGRFPQAQKFQRVLDLLNLVGISEVERVAQSYPHELSGGMRQRIAIALAINREPRLLIADEPTTALDPTIQKQVLSLLMNLQRRIGMALVFITHDVDVARLISDDVAVMYAGKIVEYGDTSTVLNSPASPYTRALLAAVPTLRSVRGYLPTVVETMAAEGIDFEEWKKS